MAPAPTPRIVLFSEFGRTPPPPRALALCSCRHVHRLATALSAIVPHLARGGSDTFLSSRDGFSFRRRLSLPWAQSEGTSSEEDVPQYRSRPSTAPPRPSSAASCRAPQRGSVVALECPSLSVESPPDFSLPPHESPNLRTMALLGPSTENPPADPTESLLGQLSGVPGADLTGTALESDGVLTGTSQADLTKTSAACTSPSSLTESAVADPTYPATPEPAMSWGGPTPRQFQHRLSASMLDSALMLRISAGGRTWRHCRADLPGRRRGKQEVRGHVGVVWGHFRFRGLLFQPVFSLFILCAKERPKQASWSTQSNCSTAVGCPPTGIGSPPTAVGYPATAFGSPPPPSVTLQAAAQPPWVTARI